MPERCQILLAIMERFGGKLRTLRQRQGLSQSQLAEQLGVSRTHVSRMERGEKVPNVAMLLKISDVFNVIVDQLIRDELEIGDGNRWADPAED